MNQLDDARGKFAADWRDLSASLRKETGSESRWPTNLVWPVLALAAGIAAGAGWWRRRNRRS